MTTVIDAKTIVLEATGLIGDCGIGIVYERDVKLANQFTRPTLSCARTSSAMGE